MSNVENISDWKKIDVDLDALFGVHPKDHITIEEQIAFCKYLVACESGEYDNPTSNYSPVGEYALIVAVFAAAAASAALVWGLF